MNEEENRQSKPKGYWIERQTTGARLLCFKGRWNGQPDERKLDIAALIVRQMRSDPEFTAYFKKLLES